MEIRVDRYLNSNGNAYKVVFHFNNEMCDTASKLWKEMKRVDKVNFKLRDLLNHINHPELTEIEYLKGINFIYNDINKDEDVRTRKYEYECDNWLGSSEAKIVITESGHMLKSTKHHTRGPFSIELPKSLLGIREIGNDVIICKDASKVVLTLNQARINITKAQFNQIISQGKVPKTIRNNYPNFTYIDHRLPMIEEDSGIHIK